VCCASWEVDQVLWVPLDRARALMHPDQALFIDRLVERLATKG
jgi:predicted NUDIX family NTP pyrophosphohydrolase